MSRIGVNSIILMAVCGATFVGSGTTCAVWASDGFRDEFNDPQPADPTAPDREPVTWGNASGNLANLNIVDGNFVVGTDLGLAMAFVDPVDFAAENVAVESQFRLIEGTNVGLFVQVSETEGGGCYFCHLAASTHPAGPMLAGIIDCSTGDWIDDARLSVDFDALEEDAVLRIEAVGNELKMWVWPADEVRPGLPSAVATTDRMPGGVVGLLVDQVDDSGPSEAAFRYFEAVVIPEPSTFLLLSVCSMFLFVLRRTSR